MNPAVVSGTIERRLLLTWRVDPGLTGPLVPEPFRLALVDGWALVGVCVIRMRSGPEHVPARLRLRSTSAAHRIAVTLPDGRPGVFVPRRHTSSRLLATLGGAVAGDHRLAEVSLAEHDGVLSAHVVGRDGRPVLMARAREVADLSETSRFATIEAASRWYETASIGCSTTRRPDHFRTIELRVPSWRAAPAEVTTIESAFFDDRRRFPRGSIHFDHGLVMHDVPHSWHVLRPVTRSTGRRHVAST